MLEPKPKEGEDPAGLTASKPAKKGSKTPAKKK